MNAPSHRSTRYTFAFAAGVCLACSIVVSTAAVGLRERQQVNVELDRQRNVLVVAGLIADDETPSRERLSELFARGIRRRVVELSTGRYDDRAPPEALHPARAAPANAARVGRLPTHTVVYQVLDDNRVVGTVFPISGRGLWSTLRGYVAVANDGNTIKAITFYEHGETPGLGGEIESQRFRDRWRGRRIYDPAGRCRIVVAKRVDADDPHGVDGISGATITSRGVSHMVRFWLCEDGFRPLLAQMREGGRS